MQSDIGLTEKLRYVAKNLEWRALRVAAGPCPICGPSIFLRFRKDPLGVRCLRCGATPFALTLVRAIREHVPDLASKYVHEASSRGPVFDFLKSQTRHFSYSEFLEDVPVGELQAGTMCQDLQALTYSDECFDLCTSTEVLEHVPDDRLAFAELHRVIKPGGHLIFTVPLFDSDTTLERAEKTGSEDGGVRHLEIPHYHDDRIRGSGDVLVYRDYGRDILDRLTGAGFREAAIFEWRVPLGLSRVTHAIVAQKIGDS